MRGIVGTSFTVRAASALSVDHSTVVSTTTRKSENQARIWVFFFSFRNVPRVTTSSAAAASLGRLTTRISLAADITDGTASGGVAEVTSFTTTYSYRNGRRNQNQGRTEGRADRGSSYHRLGSKNHRPGNICVGKGFHIEHTRIKRAHRRAMGKRVTTTKTRVGRAQKWKRGRGKRSTDLPAGLLHSP